MKGPCGRTPPVGGRFSPHRSLRLYHCARRRGAGPVPAPWSRPAPSAMGRSRAAATRHAARAVGSCLRPGWARAGEEEEEEGAQSKMAVQESAAQLSMTLKVQEYPTLKVGAEPPSLSPRHGGED